MHRHEFLRELHARIQPRGYLEIGVNTGKSLALSSVPSIGIDPAFQVTAQLKCDVRLARATSDDYFTRPDPTAHLPEGVIDLAFIDGMHLSDFAMRDFINVERYCRWTSVVVFDDMLPRSVDEAARDRKTIAWAGDVYKVAPIIRRLRPDLVCIGVDTTPTGVVVVLGADPDNRTLQEQYDGFLPELLAADPQRVPDDILRRTDAADPEQLLAAGVWDALRTARERGDDRDPSVYEAVRSLAGSRAPVPVRVPAPKPWPPPEPSAARPRRPQRASILDGGARSRSGVRRRARRYLRRLANRL